ncbi:MAG: hypothetical protein P1S60_16650 [Anaerolineae bacterium]|nr:hypothetical protein [Anaerolineae bacterium]
MVVTRLSMSPSAVVPGSNLGLQTRVLKARSWSSTLQGRATFDCERDAQPTPRRGTEPRSAGAEPRSAGAEPRSAGAEPQSAGAEPQSAGAEPQSAGADSAPPYS